MRRILSRFRFPILAVGIQLAVAPVLARQLSSGADFLKIESGARAAGMGRSYTALASDPHALFWNPAGLGLMRQPEIGYQRTQYLGGMALDFAAVGVPLQGGEGTKTGVGLGFVRLGVPSFDSTGGLEPSVASGDLAGIFGVSFARGGWSVGFDGKFVMRELAGDRARTFAGDAGVMANPIRPLRFGLVMAHVGPGLRFSEEEEPMPTLFRAGLAYTVFENYRHEVRVVTDHSIQFAGSAYRFGAGLEYQYQQLFSLRGGYSGDHDRRDVSAGAGIDLDFFRIDYAYLPFGDLGETHRMSALIRLGRPDDPGRGLRAPNSVRAQAFDRSALVDWTPVVTRDVVGYLLFVKKTGWADYRQLTKDPLKTTSVKLRKLQNGTSYEIGVVSVTAAGRRSRMVKTVVVPDPARSLQNLEMVPVGLKAELRGQGLALTWEPSAGAVGYNLYLVDALGVVVRKLNTEPIERTMVQMKNLVPDRTYRFQVSAVGKGGTESAPSAPVEARLTAETVTAAVAEPAPTATATPEPPLVAPSVITALPGVAQATLMWEPVPGASGYNLYVSNDGGVNWKRLNALPLKENRAVLRPLKPRLYHFALTSVSPSGTESVKALAAPVLPLAAP